jgi:hypothetical protein
MDRYDHETFLTFVQYLYKLLITDMAWYSGTTSREDFKSASDSNDVSGDTTDDPDRVEYRTQICLDLLRELEEVLLNHLTALFDEKLQEDTFLRSLAVDDSEMPIVPEFCFELHHRIWPQTWNENLMTKAMYFLAIGWGPTNSMFLFLKGCFESEDSSRAVEVFRDFNGFDALWHHARSRRKNSVRREAARSTLFSYYAAAARAPPNLAHGVFEEDFDRLKHTGIFVIVIEKIFAELQKTWDQHLEMPSTLLNDHLHQSRLTLVPNQIWLLTSRVS